MQEVDIDFADSLLYPHNERQLRDYVWIVVVGALMSFFVAFGIGKQLNFAYELDR